MMAKIVTCIYRYEYDVRESATDRICDIDSRDGPNANYDIRTISNRQTKATVNTR